MARRLQFPSLGSLRHGIGANLYAQVITITLQIVSLPVFLSEWTLGRYGEWLVLVSIQGYVGLADLGLMAVAMNKISVLAARQAEDEALQTLYRTVAMSAAALGIGVTLLFFCLSIPLHAFQGLLSLDATMALLWLIAHSQVSLFNSVADAAFRSEDRYATGTYTLETVRLFEWVAAIGALKVVGSLQAVGAAYFAVRACAMATIFAYQSTAAYKCRLNRGRFHAAELLALARPAASWFMVRAADLFSLQGATLAVAYAAGPARAAEFNVYRTLSRVVVQCTSIVAHSVWPEITRLLGTGDAAGLRKTMNAAIKLTCLLSTALAVGLFLMSPLIISRWSRGTVTFDWAVQAVFTVSVLATSWAYLARIYFVATDQLQRFARIYLLLTLTGLTLMVVVHTDTLIVPSSISACIEVVALLVAARLYTDSVRNAHA